ncbi:MAG: hypothetical protein C4334_03275 [Pyrinomonas sp.]
MRASQLDMRRNGALKGLLKECLAVAIVLFLAPLALHGEELQGKKPPPKDGPRVIVRAPKEGEGKDKDKDKKKDEEGDRDKQGEKQEGKGRGKP